MARVEAGLFQQWMLIDEPERIEEARALQPVISEERKAEFLRNAPEKTPEQLERIHYRWDRKENALFGNVFALDADGQKALSMLSRYERSIARRIERDFLANP